MSLGALLAMSLFLRRSSGRFFFFMVGAIIVLGPIELTPAKFAYIAILTFISLFSARAVIANSKNYGPEGLNHLMRIQQIAVILFLLIVICVLSAAAQSTPVIEIFRGILPLYLCAMGLPICIDAGIKMKERDIGRLVILFGILCSFAFWFVWSKNYGLTKIRTDSFLLPADFPGYLALIYLLKNRIKFVFSRFLIPISVTLIVVLFFFSLSRTSILLVAFILVASWFFGENKKITISLILVLMTLSFVAVRINAFNLFTNYSLSRRIFGSIEMFQNAGFSALGLGSDTSLQLRTRQGQTALELWKENSVFGVGVLPPKTTFDHIFASLAQFGLFGVFLICILLFLIARLFVQLQVKPTRDFGVWALFYLTLIPASLIYNWTSNKGFWISIDILFAIYFSKHFDSLKQLRDKEQDKRLIVSQGSTVKS